MGKRLDEKAYRSHLQDQIYFLQSSAKLYDLGTEIEAKRMAVSLRVLLAEIPDNYTRLKESSLTGWVFRAADGTERGMDNDPVYASMRQMTFEVLQSLYMVKQPLFAEKYF